MENLDIIILSSIVSVLFVVFIYFVFKELSKPESEFVITEDNGPRTKMIKKVGSIFDQIPQNPPSTNGISKSKDKYFEISE